MRRRRNPRGQGDRLRGELLQAALGMVEAGAASQLSLRSVAREVGIAATSVYIHFPDLDHLLAAVVELGFDQLTEATNRAAEGVSDPREELLARCREHCRFGIEHAGLYQLMFQADLPAVLAADPDATPGRRSFENLARAVRGCLESGLAPPHDDPFRLAAEVWTAEHGLVLARLSRPGFPWAPLDEMVTEVVSRLMGFSSAASG